MNNYCFYIKYLLCKVILFFKYNFLLFTAWFGLRNRLNLFPLWKEGGSSSLSKLGRFALSLHRPEKGLKERARLKRRRAWSLKRRDRLHVWIINLHYLSKLMFLETLPLLYKTLTTGCGRPPAPVLPCTRRHFRHRVGRILVYLTHRMWGMPRCHGWQGAASLARHPVALLCFILEIV